MRAFPNLTMAIVVAVLIGLAAFQGRLVDEERDTRDFYKWLVSASDSLGRDGRIVPADVLADFPNLEDEALFEEVATAMEPLVEAPPATEDDIDAKGETLPGVVRLIRSKSDFEAGDAVDHSAWYAARSSDLASLRDKYNELRQRNLLYSATTKVGVADLYGENNVSANLGNLFFGFRKMAANLLWLQCDNYFHSGENHLLVPTIRTVVTLDPHFVDAYLIGAWHLSYNIPAKLKPTPELQKRWSDTYQAYVGPREEFIHEGIALLKNGIKNNPRNYKLYFDLGFGIYEEKLQDHENAAIYLGEAVRYRHEPFVARSLYRVQMYAGDFEESKAGWQNYLQNYDPNFMHAPRFIQYCDAQIFEREGDELNENAKDLEAQGDSAAAEAARAEAKEYYDKAREIWNAVIAEWGKDPLAESRIHIMDANEYLAQGRCYEAIALLQLARLSIPLEYYQQVSDDIIKHKLECGIDLDFSEKQALVRKEDAERAIAQREARRLAAADSATSETAEAAAPRRQLTMPMLLLGLIAVAALGFAGYQSLKRGA